MARLYVFVLLLTAVVYAQAFKGRSDGYGNLKIIDKDFGKDLKDNHVGFHHDKTQHMRKNRRHKLMKDFALDHDEIAKKVDKFGHRMFNRLRLAEAGACGKCPDDEECVQMKNVAKCMKSEKIMKKMHKKYLRFMRNHPEIRKDMKRNMAHFKKEHFKNKNSPNFKKMMKERKQRKFNKFHKRHNKMTKAMNQQQLLEATPDLSELMEKGDYIPVDEKQMPGHFKRGVMHHKEMHGRRNFKGHGRTI